MFGLVSQRRFRELEKEYAAFKIRNNELETQLRAWEVWNAKRVRDQLETQLRALEHQLAEILHQAGLDAYADYRSMGCSAEEWNKFRLKIAAGIIERIRK